MAISQLAVRSGVGAWADIAHLITRGLDIGTVVVITTTDIRAGQLRFDASRLTLTMDDGTMQLLFTDSDGKLVIST